MRVIFFGFQTWGLITLRALVGAGFDVVMALTHFDSTKEQEMSFNESVRDFATENHIPVTQCNELDYETLIPKITEAEADIIVSSNWRRRISPIVFGCTRFGAVNIHRSLLPKYGGFAPINWAIVNGESETGVTIHMITEAFDLGDIVAQELVPIRFTDTATDVFHRMTPIIIRMVPEALRNIGAGASSFTPQDPEQATFFHKRLERDNLIDWKKSNVEVYNLVRAQCDPFPNAFTFLKGTKLKIKSASLADRKYRGTPGRVFSRVADGVVVLCGNSPESGQGLVVQTVQDTDGPPIGANDYFDRMGYYLGE